MKTLLIILILLFTFCLSAVTFDLTLSLRSPKDPDNSVDFEIGGRCTIDSLLSLETSFERDNGENFTDFEIFMWQYWKFLQLSGKYINIQEDSLTVASVDLRVKYKTLSLGVAETWDLHPELMLVFGKDTRHKLGIPYLIPIEFRLTTNFYTNDFQEFNNETEMQFSGAVSSIVSVYVRYKCRYYDEYNFQFKIGLGIKL